MKKQQIIFKNGGRITTASFIKNENMRYGQIRFKGGGRIKNIRITGLDNGGGGGEEGGGGGEEGGEYKDEECLGFTAVDGDVTVSLQNNDGNAPIIYYKQEGQDWTLWNYTALTIAEGETVRFYGENDNGFSNSLQKYSNFVMSGNGNIEAFGECSSLLSKKKFDFVPPYCFAFLFNNCDKLITAPILSAKVIYIGGYSHMFSFCRKLITAPELPAIHLDDSCYDGMFYYCKALITAPELPAIYLRPRCYLQMFFNCSSLINAPKLPATDLTISCYELMFRGCTNLTNAPDLLATTLISGCYRQMFFMCDNLKYIKALFLTKPAYEYTADWLGNVAANGTFVKNSQATWNVSGSNGIPTGWTVETANN